MSETPATIGPFQIVRPLGQGGMGTLFLGFDPKLERSVAIKLLRDNDDELRERFAREARAAAKLSHRNIVAIFAVGEENGQPFIAMEYVDGSTLGELVRRSEPLSLPRRLFLIEELCSGLGFAHSRGIVHRDIKPANVMLANDGALKILDFGIARAMGASEMTKAGMLIGTLNYMSPEQVAGQPADHRSDIFAVGSVLYELLTYKQAFPGNLQTGILHKILHGQPTPVRDLAADVDAAAAAIVERALQKEPEARYQDLETMRHELEAVRRRLEAAGRPATVPGGTDWSKLSSLRTEQVAKNLTSAEAAFASGDFAGAVAFCEQALLLDPTDVRITEIIERVRRKETEAQARRWLDEARDHIQAGEVTVAIDLVDRASSILPNDPRIATLRHDAEAAHADREEHREREAGVERELDRARGALRSGDLDTCQEAVAKVLSIDAANAEALAIRQHADIKAAVAVAAADCEAGRLAEADLHTSAAERRAPENSDVKSLRQRVDQVIREAVAGAAAAARRKVAEGDYDGAERLLREFRPVTPDVQRERAGLARDIERVKAASAAGMDKTVILSPAPASAASPSVPPAPLSQRPAPEPASHEAPTLRPVPAPPTPPAPRPEPKPEPVVAKAPAPKPEPRPEQRAEPKAEPKLAPPPPPPPSPPQPARLVSKPPAGGGGMVKIAAAAAVVLVGGGVAWWALQPGPPVETVATTVPPATVATTSVPAGEGGTSVVTSAPATVRAADGVVQSAQALWTKGDRTRALETLRPIMGTMSADPAVARVIGGWLDTARTESDAARRAALGFGESVRARPPFSAGEQKTAEATQFTRTGRRLDAIARFGEAEEFYKQAGAMASVTTSAAPPPPPTTSVATTSVAVVAPPTSAATTSVPVDDDTRIRETVAAYAAALSSRNGAAVRRLFPSAPRSLEANLENLSSQSTKFTVLRINRNGGSAQVVVRNYTVSRVRGQDRDMVVDRDSTFDMRRNADGSWIIQAIK